LVPPLFALVGTDHLKVRSLEHERFLSLRAHLVSRLRGPNEGKLIPITSPYSKVLANLSFKKLSN